MRYNFDITGPSLILYTDKDAVSLPSNTDDTPLRIPVVVVTGAVQESEPVVYSPAQGALQVSYHRTFGDTAHKRRHSR